jgi:hypothetical protein
MKIERSQPGLNARREQYWSVVINPRFEGSVIMKWSAMGMHPNIEMDKGHSICE